MNKPSQQITPVCKIALLAGASGSSPKNGSGPLGNIGSIRDLGGTIQLTGGNADVSTATLGGVIFEDQGGIIDNESAAGAMGTNTGSVSLSATQTRSTGITVGLTKRTLTFTGAGTANGYVYNTLSDLTSGSGGTAVNDVTSLMKSGSGTWVLQNTAGTYTGTTTISSGTLGVGVTNAISSVSVLTLGAAGSGSNTTLDLGPLLGVTTGSQTQTTSFNQTVAGLNSAGNGLDLITNSDTTAAVTNHVATLTVSPTGTGAADSTFGGVIQNGVTSRVALTKASTNTLTLTGTNTYTGATNVSGGTLSISGSIASPNLTLNGTTNTGPTVSLVLMSATALSGTPAVTVTTASVTPTIFLDFTGNTNVTSLLIGGISEPAGIYGANNTDPSSVFGQDGSSLGTFTVAPEPGAASLIGVIGTGLLARRRRRIAIADCSKVSPGSAA